MSNRNVLEVRYSLLLISNHKVTNRHVRGIPPVLVDLDRVFVKTPKVASN